MLLSQIALGEDSTRQFKADVKNADSLASEMAAFANTNGSTIFIGVADDDSTPGLSGQDVARINQLISNAASHLVRSPLAVQPGRGVNAPGLPEIPEAVFEERLVNALVHRDYLVCAPIRLFVFDNRIEIISPGHLPNNLTVEKIRAGNSNIRNPILVSYVAKGLLPYHGLGSGIKRALGKWSAIDFAGDHDGCLFTATVHRKPVEELDLADKGALTGQVAGLSGHTDPINDLLNALRTEPSAGYAALAERLEVSEATVKRNIQKLKQQNRIRRIGSKKTGHWEVIE